MAEPGARLLHHLWLSPFCRKVRVCLAEKGLDFVLRTEKVWEQRPEFLALNPAYVVLSQNPARGDGGTCYGDSGGPNFLRLDDGREVVAAVTVTGDRVCRATNVDARVDTGNARAFLATVPGLVLP